MALKIIGAGMGRTGTASLKVALEALNMGHCYHMTEVLKNPEYTQYWINATEDDMWDKMENRMQDREYMVDFFNKHTAEIIDSINPERLLVYQVSDGWAPLCKFLEVPVPNLEYPRINSRNEIKELLANLMASSGDQLSEDAMAKAARELHGD